VHVVAFLTDLMDRSRLTGALVDLTFATDPLAARDADAVLIDLTRFGPIVAAIRAVAPDARIVAFGPHVDTASLAQAIRDGADAAIPRSQLFRDPTAAVSGEPI
jgi:DNA-binding NarL/FixJ family response regulator